MPVVKKEFIFSRAKLILFKFAAYTGQKINYKFIILQSGGLN